MEKKRNTDVESQYFKNITDFRNYLNENSDSCYKTKSWDGRYYYTYESDEYFVNEIFYPIANRFTDDSNTWIDFWGSELDDNTRIVIYEVGIYNYDDARMYLQYTIGQY